MKEEIIHDEESGRFVIHESQGDAYLKYMVNGNVMDIISTYVPNSLRGQGIADKITRMALDYARSRDMKIIPTCPYTDTFVRRHHEYTDLIKEE